MTRVAIIAAMPGELKPLVRHWQTEPRDSVHLWHHRIEGGEWAAACAGAGVGAAARAFAEIEHDGPVDAIISTGWAGALTGELQTGQAYSVAGVIDARTGERFPPSSRSGGLWLVTSPKVANEREKQRLAATYGASLVDMEAAAIARIAQMRGVPFYCVKGISDGYKDQLPDFNRFLLPDGRFRLAGFVLFALIRPWHWPALIRMGENSKRAAQSIAESLLQILHQ